MQKRARLVSVIIPTRNRQRDAIECLKSLFQVEYTHHEVIVVGNASTDGTAAAVCQAFPQVKLVENERDLWATDGRNAGLKHVRGGYIFWKVIEAIGRFDESGLRRYDVLKAYLRGSWDGLICEITGRLRDRKNWDKKYS